MSCRGVSTIGRSGLAALVAFCLLALPAAASAADGKISGKVTFTGGANVAGAEVCAEAEAEADVGCASSEADGDYEITGLEPGNYVVTFEATESSPYVVFQRRAGDVAVADGTTTTGIDAAVIKGGAIEGTVSDATTGLPLDEVEVSTFWEAENKYDGFDVSGSNGSFRVIGVNPGPHEIEFWSWEGEYETRFVNVSIVAGATINANAFLIRKPPPEGRMGGHVYALATHQPLAGVAVCAIDEFGESRGCAHTSDVGAYEFIEVPAGEWRIAFSPAPGEFEAFEPGEIVADAWPTQFWDMKTTLAQADVIYMFRGLSTGAIDGYLGPGPKQAPPPPGETSLPNSPNPTPIRTPVAVTPAPKPLTCKKGFVKKRIKGKQRCVKRHKPRHHKKHRGHR